MDIQTTRQWSAIYILRNKNQNSLRRRYNLRKSHENDARLLYFIYKENPRYFREYVKRQLDNDPDIQRYVLLLREIRRTRHKIKINKKFKLPTDDLENYLKELQRKLMKLFYHLKKRYKNILDKFSDIKGLSGGNLLYFLTLMPEFNSFESTRSYLIYLGLRNAQGKRWNREARNTLIKMALKTARYSNIKLNPRKPNWKYIRRLAILIYIRLREKAGDGEVDSKLSPPNRRG